MTVSRVLARIADAMASLDNPPTLAGTASPTNASELPAITLSALDIEAQLTGIGARPAPSRQGALAVSDRFDLASPVADFPDGSQVILVTPDRITFFLPFGPAVARDGIALANLLPGDITVSIDGAPQTIVATDPDANEVRVNTQLGTIEFGTPLPVTGQLDVAWFIGEWEVTVHRFQGTLAVEIYGATAAEIDDLSSAVEQAIVPEAQAGIDGLISVSPQFFGPTGPRIIEAGNARRRRVEFVIDAEIEDPLLLGGGGLISQIDIDSTFGAEAFSVPGRVDA